MSKSQQSKKIIRKAVLTYSRKLKELNNNIEEEKEFLVSLLDLETGERCRGTVIFKRLDKLYIYISRIKIEDKIYKPLSPQKLFESQYQLGGVCFELNGKKKWRIVGFVNYKDIGTGLGGFKNDLKIIDVIKIDEVDDPDEDVSADNAKDNNNVKEGQKGESV